MKKEGAHMQETNHGSKSPNDCMDQRVQQHMRIFDGFEELVYVMDLETYELLYLNKAGRSRFQIDDYTGKKCYDVLHGLSSPCAFCPNAHVNCKKFYCWEKYNEKINRHVILKDIVISWFGKPAKLEIAYDVTDHDKQLIALRNSYEMEQVTMECVRKLYEASNPKAAIDMVLKKTGEFLEAERTYVFEQVGTCLNNTYEWCATNIIPAKPILQHVEWDIFAPAKPSFEKHESWVLLDIETLRDTYPDTYVLLKKQEIRHMIITPIFNKDRFIGCIGADNPDPEKLRSFSLLDTIGYFISLSFEKMETQKAMMEYSYMDGLTGLYNRNRYMQDLHQYETKASDIFGVVYMDINDLKGVNDRKGHIGGDTLIKEAAGYLKQIFQDEDCYRIGGDEFIVLIKHLTQLELEEQMHKLRNLFALSPTCSAAIGYIYQSDGNVSEMVKLADERMYENKKEYYRTHVGNGRYRSLHDETLALQMPLEVQKAIDQNQFVVYLQPKASMDIQEVIGSEALVRYIDSQGNLVPPDQFIPILENYHTIHMIDFYVFETVCKAISRWLTEGKDVKPVSVNFSRYTLMLDNFVYRVTTIWSKYAIPQNLLEIEIIERAENIGSEYLIKVMREIKQLGFRVSIDDFGVKYSNLFLFTNTNIDTLKLDRSLILDLPENEKSQMIIAVLSTLCENLHIQLIVEGVETQEQLSILERLNCDGIQGYLFSRPIPLEEFSVRFVKQKDTTS